MSLDPVTVTKLWLLIRPFQRFKSWRAKRKGKRMAVKLPVIDIGTRTTTNAGVSGMIVWGVLKAVSHFFPEFPTDGLEELIGAIVAYVVGYLTKTPAQPKVL